MVERAQDLGPLDSFTAGNSEAIAPFAKAASAGRTRVLPPHTVEPRCAKPALPRSNHGIQRLTIAPSSGSPS